MSSEEITARITLHSPGNATGAVAHLQRAHDRLMNTLEELDHFEPRDGLIDALLVALQNVLSEHDDNCHACKAARDLAERVTGGQVREAP